MKKVFILLYFFTFLSGAALCAELKEFAVIITSYNNARWYEKNLGSVFSQDYPKYRVIYMDDASPDGTADLVEQFVKKHNQQHRFTMVRNATWQSQMANHYRAAHMCKKNEIIVHIDGDDWLAHNQVLSKLNAIYQDPNVWITHGQNSVNTCYDIPANVVAENNFRRGVSLQALTHLRTFYAWLFQEIKLEDLICLGSFKTTSPSPDVFFTYPMFEMASNRTKFIPELLYMWNRDNNLSQSQLLATKPKEWKWWEGSDFFNWNKYSALQGPVVAKNLDNAKATIIVFAQDEKKLSRCLASFEQKISGYDRIHIIIENTKKHLFKNFIAKARQTIHYSNDTSMPLQSILTSIFDTSAEHIMLCDDSALCTSAFSINICIKELERTFAFGFYLQVDSKNFAIKNSELVTPHLQLTPQIVAWQFKYADQVWKEIVIFRELYKYINRQAYSQQLGSKPELKSIYSIKSVLYRKKDFIDIISKFSAKDFEQFTTKLYAQNALDQYTTEWHCNVEPVGRKVGLCFANSKIQESSKVTINQ